MLNSEVNAFDLLVFECIRLLLPGTFQFLYQNGQYFHAPPRVIERWSTDVIGIDEQARNKATAVAFESYFNTLSKAEKDLSLNLLAFIFPSVRNYIREHSLDLLGVTYQSEEHRISDADFFPRYFIYSVPATLYGEKEMDNFVASICNTDQSGLAAAVEAAYPRPERDDLRRIDFLRRLKLRAPDIPDAQAESLALYLAEHISEMRSEHIAYIVTESLVLTLIGRYQGSQKLQRGLDNVVLKTDSDRFASDIVYSCVSASKKDSDEITDWSGFDPELIKACFGKRMRSRHPTPVNTLQLSSEDVMAFSRWRVYVPADVPYITEYFRSAFDSDVKNLGSFLQSLLPGNVSYQGSPIKFVDSFFPVTEITERLDEAELKTVLWGAEQAAAIKRFRDYLKKMSNESAPEPATDQRVDLDPSSSQSGI